MEDLIIAEIRQYRREYTAQCNDNLLQMVQNLQAQQLLYQQQGWQLVALSTPKRGYHRIKRNRTRIDTDVRG